MKKKLIFLDIDGVLNSDSSCVAYGGFPFPDDPNYGLAKFQHVSLELMKKLVEKTGAEIVLSSTWREHLYPVEFGKVLGLPIISRTPSYGRCRGDEIKQWIDNEIGLELESYVIIDDISQFLPEQLQHFVHTNGENGFMLADYKQACEILGTPDENLRMFK